MSTATVLPRGLVRTVLRLHRTALIVWAVFVLGSVGCLVWLTAKLALPALALLLGGAVFVPVYRWAWSAHRELMGDHLLFNDVFADHGPLVVAYGLCALAVGTLTGLLLGRPLPALAVSVAAMTLLNRALEQRRPDPLPASAFWPAHLTEAALVLTAAALTTTAAFRLLHHRTA
ncbi:hypothetical protein [Streptomyces pseudovenezuelae]|uniref:Histidine kinase n=1 Tax=Streptomyces pseudovenezuelae TaxID=67350 RepID=A0ABZ1WXW0_9ACTN|nr:hypothetical protein [Streptomyces pseudovenezuelae]